MTKHNNFKEGSLVTGPFGWQTHVVSKGSGVLTLPDFGDLPASYGIGALGMPGYVSLLSVAHYYHNCNCQTICNLLYKIYCLQIFHHRVLNAVLAELYTFGE